MKKVVIFLLAILVLAGAVTAQEGLYLGAELGIGDFSAAGDTMSVTPYVGYGIEVIDGLELGVELTLPITFDPFVLGIGLEPGITYGVGIVYFGLAFPMDIYSTADGAEAFSAVGLNFTVGAEFDAGFGLEATLYNTIKPSSWLDYLDIYGFYGMDALSFGVCVGLPLYEDGFKAEGLTITPDVGYDINDNLNVYAELPIFGVGSDPGIGVGLTVGVKYSF